MLEKDDRVVISDLEAGVGTLLRMSEGHADYVLIVTEPSLKSIEAARRAAEIAGDKAKTIIVANRVDDEDDVEEIKKGLPGFDVHIVPDDRAIARADRDGVAPIELEESPGVAAIVALAERLLA